MEFIKVEENYVFVCRLCLLTKTDNFLNLEGETLNSLKFVVPEIDVNTGTNLKICTSCSLNLSDSFEFKTICLCKNEDQIKTETLPNNDTAGELSSVSNIKEEVVSKCSNCNIITLNNENGLEENQDDFLNLMRENCLSDVYPSRFSNPCVQCLDSLENLYLFFNNCMDSNEKIKEYCLMKDISDCNKVDLGEVSLFIQESATKIKNENPPVHEVVIKNEQTENTAESEGDEKFKEENDIDEKHIKRSDTEENSTKRFKCTECSFRTHVRNYLTRHMLVHKDPSEVQMFKCDVCPFATKRKHCLKVHSMVHNNAQNRYRCNTCNYSTRIKFNLERHEKSHESIREFFYRTTNKINFDRLDEFIVRIEPSESQALQGVDSSAGLTPTGLKNASLSKSIAKNFYRILGNGSKTPSRATKTETESTEPEVTFRCSKCTFKTDREASLKKHEIKHRRAYSAKNSHFKCINCSYTTHNKQYLLKHEFIHKDLSKVQKYQCRKCGFWTKYKHCLERHILRHKEFSEIVPFECNLCSFKAKRKDEISRHVKTHVK